jgi:hypothetical protein
MFSFPHLCEILSFKASKLTYLSTKNEMADQFSYNIIIIFIFFEIAMIRRK